jgi:hypothetical protein
VACIPNTSLSGVGRYLGVGSHYANLSNHWFLIGGNKPRERFLGADA